MIECARCGYKNDAAAKFCAACGAPMTAAQSPLWGPAAAQQPPQNWGQPVPQPVPPQWGPPPAMQPPPLQWGAPQQVPAAPPQAMAYGAQPQWGAPAAPAPAAPPAPVGPSWGQPAPMLTPEAVPLRPTAPDPAPPPVVPTTASAAIAPLEADQIPPNAPRTLAAFLVNFDADPLGLFWPVHQGQNLVGRKGSCAELHLEIDHPTTSSRHATIHAAARPGRLKVEDLGSTNGTYINERRLEPGERRALEPGDTLRFGGFSVTVIPV